MNEIIFALNNLSVGSLCSIAERVSLGLWIEGGEITGYQIGDGGKLHIRNPKTDRKSKWG